MIFIKTKEDFLKYSQFAKDNPDSYWEQVASSFNWHSKWENVLSGDFNNLEIKWFEGAKLNITENCLDRHLETQPDKTAIIFEANDPSKPTRTFTYKELHQEVCKTANLLKAQGIKKGDVVCFYMAMIPELMIGVLACARIGAIHSVVFGGFSAKALRERINDSQAKILMTNDAAIRGDKTIYLKKIADEALQECPSIKHVLVYNRCNEKINWVDGRDINWNEAISDQSSECAAEIMDAESPLFILYTSGSTGKPKGLMHTTAGYMVYAQYSFDNVFQMDDDDIFWCTADVGWITGHTYMTYAPLLSGKTQVVFEGVPTWPDASRFWMTIDKHKVTHFYTAPTAIRALEAMGVDFVKKADLSTLKVLGSVGEPINEEAWQWYYHHVGHKKCPIVDTWWQTETGGIMISPLAHISEMKPSYALNPLPGIEPSLVNSHGNELPNNDVEGNLIIKRPWPSIARTIYGDHERFRQTYFSTYPGFYFTGDGAKRDHDGHLRVIGRVDDVINVSGHRIGTAEVEDALNQHHCVVESAVVGYPHDIKGSGIYAYVILAQESSGDLKKELQDMVTHQIGSFAKPEKIQVVSGLPKTRSGKIMRRILRKVACGDTQNLGDTTTLLNPQIVDEIISGKTL